MTDPRKPVFDAARAAGARFRTQDDVALFDGVLTRLGIPKTDASTPGPVPAPSGVKKGVTASLIGGSAAAALMAALVSFEGQRNVGYADIAGIPTACVGDTANVVVGKFYSDEECHSRLDRQAAAHVAEVLRCTPSLKGRDDQLVAAGSLAYNIGGAAWCASTADKRFDAGQWKAGCDAMLAWDKARVNGGKPVVVRGLTVRRQAEHAICVRSLT